MSRKRICLILSAVLFIMTACSAPSEEYLPPATDSTAHSDPSESLRIYYEALVADLKQEILDLKQSNYVAALEYESRIAELESELTAAEPSPSDTNVPVSAPSDPRLPTESAPAESTPSHTTEAAFHYIIQNDTAVICAYTGRAANVVIPREIVGFPVTCIADEAFKGTAVTTVIIPDTVTEIGWFTFADCPQLISVTLPASVTSIGYGAFDGCPRLTVYCPRDSYAAAYALSFAMRVRYV